LDSISGGEGSYTITLSFPEDATSVSMDLCIPADATLPVAVGEEIKASVSASCCWYSSYSAVSLYTLNGLLLLTAFSGGTTLSEVPPACEETGPLECGWMGYPDLKAGHPFGLWDPSAPWVRLRQGEEAVQVHRGVAYRSVVSTARTWTENQCTDTPQTYLSSATFLVPTPALVPVPFPFSVSGAGRLFSGWNQL
ncbi:MAG: hypothetical protein RBU30_15215, partial [Polyangia bacterium]|nr:hypothetical protein [Polyangia bacterium]